MKPARECLKDANRLAEANRREHNRTPRWHWVKRQRLDREWMEITNYRHWMTRIIREENPQ